MCQKKCDKQFALICFNLNVDICVYYLHSYKATRKICGAVKSGVREFTSTGFKITTGEKICSANVDFNKKIKSRMHKSSGPWTKILPKT